MKYTNKIPEYTIDLELPEDERWLDVIKKEKKIAKKLLGKAIKDIDEIASPLLRKLISPIFKNIYHFGGGMFSDEMNSWAKGTGMSMSELVLANCTYELSHVQEGINIFGCTAGVRFIPGMGMVHVRNMDWPIDEIGKATRVFRFKEGEREFISVGLPGKVSVISGMLPGAYSVTINWAPTKMNPRFDYGPSFLLREIFETCDTYDEAVSYLCGTDLSSSVFFTVCGTKKGEGCVIERIMNSYNVREWSGGVLTQANHFEGKFKSNNKSIINSCCLIVQSKIRDI